MTKYGQRGGDGPTRGKKVSTYRTTLPDGRTATRRTFTDHGPTSPATAFEHNGKIRMAVWGSGPVAWEGDFGRLVATKVED